MSRGGRDLGVVEVKEVVGGLGVGGCQWGGGGLRVMESRGWWGLKVVRSQGWWGSKGWWGSRGRGRWVRSPGVVGSMVVVGLLSIGWVGQGGGVKRIGGLSDGGGQGIVGV